MEIPNLRASFSDAKNGDTSAIEMMSVAAANGHPDAGEVLLEEARKLRVKLGVPLKEALNLVFESDPQLHRAYLNANGV